MRAAVHTVEVDPATDSSGIDGACAMEHLIRGVRDAVQKRSWYAATALALMLPDACAAVEAPGRGRAAQRYIRWADRWTKKYFSDKTGKTFLSGRDLFQLRCAFLHEGDFTVSRNTPKSMDDAAAMFEVLNRVTLYASDVDVVPARTMASTGSDRATGYGIGVAGLCESICGATESWLAQARTDPKLAQRIEELARVGAIIHVSPDFEMHPL
jgi:hypothetical protein